VKSFPFARLAVLLTVLLAAAWPPARPLLAETKTVPTSAVAGSAAAAEANRPAEAARFLAMVRKLADANMEGRGPGTKGIERARDYIAGELEHLGLRPAFGQSFLQGFEVPLAMKVASQELSLEARGKAPVAQKAGSAFEAFGFSADGAFAGEAAFVGYGISNKQRNHDSFAGAAADCLKGKVAVILRYEPQDANGVSLWTKKKDDWTAEAGLTGKADNAVARGAAAVLIVNPPAHDSGKVDPAARTSMGTRLKVPVLHVSGATWRAILAAAGCDAEAGRRLQMDADAGTAGVVPLGVTLRGAVKLAGTRAAVHNVGAVLGGAGAPADEWLIIGAHYDHLGFGRGRTSGKVFYPGADDNASGTAGVLTLARRFAERLRGGAAPASRRSILFVTFTCEEIGLVGSRHLARHLSEASIKPGRVNAMLNMDMIGRCRNGMLYVWGVDSGTGLRKIVESAVKDSPLKPRLTGPVTGASDHLSFGAIKVPSLGFCTGMHADLHRPTDTADKIDPAGAVVVLDLVDAIAQKLWSGGPRMSFTASTQPAGTGAYLGVSADEEAEQAGGCRVGAVVPGGPADKGGLQSGDVVTAWDGQKIAGAGDLVAAIRRSRPGAKVKLSVRRDDKTMELTVQLGRR